MDRLALLDRLDKATDRGARLAISKGLPIKLSRKSTLIGGIFVEKSTNDLYDVILPSKTPIYRNISVFDVAVIIAQRHNSGEAGVIRKVLDLEKRYSKYRTDMVHYLNCLKGAKKRHDIERMAILEDKFQIAEIFAKNARDSISIFKRVR